MLKSVKDNKPEDQDNMTPSKETTTTEKCIKVWSENTQKWRYIPKDPAYFKTKYYKYLGEKTCAICGSMINTQMSKHVKSKRCLLVKKALENQINNQGLESFT